MHRSLREWKVFEARKVQCGFLKKQHVVLVVKDLVRVTRPGDWDRCKGLGPMLPT